MHAIQTFDLTKRYGTRPVKSVLEFSWRTARQKVIDGLSKERFYAGKAVVLVGLVLLFMGTTVLIGVGGAMLSPGGGGPVSSGRAISATWAVSPWACWSSGARA